MAMVVGWRCCCTFWLAPWLRDLLLGLCLYGREGRGFMPRPPRGCGVLFLLTLLGELEPRLVDRAVFQLHREQTAGSAPSFVRLPEVVVLVDSRVVVEAARAGGADLLKGIGRARVAVDLCRGRCRDRGAVEGEDVHALVTREAELHRDGATGLDGVPRWQVIYGAAEAVELVSDRQGALGEGYGVVVRGQTVGSDMPGANLLRIGHVGREGESTSQDVLVLAVHEAGEASRERRVGIAQLLALIGGRNRKGCGIDVGGGGPRTGLQGVVILSGAAEREARRGYSLAGASICCTEGSRAATEADVVGADLACHRAARDCGRGGAVVGLVGSGEAAGQLLGVYGGRSRPRTGLQSVVALVGARQAKARGGHRLVLADVLV